MADEGKSPTKNQLGGTSSTGTEGMPLTCGTTVVDPALQLSTVSTTLVDPAEHLESLVHVDEHAARPMKLSDFANILRTSNRFSEVTDEQIARIRKIHEIFDERATFSFNYNTLLLVASILAGLGLVSNSSTTVIASTLVSPIMGPVVGMAYGSTILDWKLVRKSLFVECVSLFFCIVVGAIIGAISGLTALADKWPTQEMVVRATLANLLVGLPVAFFSGLGVAVSLLDAQTNSLVGVAISASLLPPAVNAGIFWVAFCYVVQDRLGEEPGEPVPPVAGAPTPAPTPDESEYEFARSDFRYAGLTSFILTLANIVLIWVSSMLMFRLKEVRIRICARRGRKTLTLVVETCCRCCRSRRKFFGVI